ncbi:TonB-dependent receptor [Antarcticibacterium sp. 1MA-6-2]|uniref:TonB-dependent receptor domain-containing protein n=1 Tax=Antarcticibacterium sp. 1MA-6-2 TaxID=2908210 RepID=UPI001F200690|nr:TonB-dependent receptor [Antarcticibacterium sp. 1MA-6-2]UJH91968.1 TonB-dependent receptor [Antarcticibacterium sp. 1MA-6-2]
MRKESTNNYKSPFLFSAGGRYKFSEFYILKLNVSRNFRIPTYNDLYWTTSGNTVLNPEVSLQGEIGNSFTWKGIGLDLTAYYIDIKNMIQWIPGSNGEWRPRNVAEVRTYGLEGLMRWNRKIGDQQYVNLNATYAYTVSENRDTYQQLIYVPFHKTTASLEYKNKRWEVNYQLMFNGEVFTRSNNDTRYNLSSYSVSNIASSYGFGNMANYRLGARVNNLFDEAYQSMENRWMPGINFNIYLNLNF